MGKAEVIADSNDKENSVSPGKICDDAEEKGTPHNVSPFGSSGGGIMSKKRRTSVIADQANWVSVQKKTFTRWCNAYLARSGKHIDNLNTDLADGLALHQLLSVLADEKLPKILKKPKLRIQKMENVGVCLKWLTTGEKSLKLVGIGAADLVDGVEKLILGLIWTIILRFDVADAGDKAGLLLWCKRSVNKYKGVHVTNFTSTWNNGKAFLALIHRYRPDLLDFDPTDDSAENLARAFRIAEEQLGIAQFLDVEDVADNVRPDEKSIVAYVSQFFKLFAGAVKNDALVKCIAKAVGVTRRHQDWMQSYNAGAKDLLAWVQRTATEHTKHDSTNDHMGSTTADVYAKLRSFRHHLREVKPTKLQDKLEIDGIYTTLSTSVRQHGRPVFQPAIKPETIQVCWDAMEAADRTYECDLRDRMIRFQQADAETARFNAKAANVGKWLHEKETFFAQQLPVVETELLSLGELEGRHEAHMSFLKRFDQYKTSVFRKMRSIAETAPEAAAGHAGVAAMAGEMYALELKAEEVEASGDAYTAAIAKGLERERQLLRTGRDFDKSVEGLEFALNQVEEDLSLPLGSNGNVGVTAGVQAIRDMTVSLVPLQKQIDDCLVRVADLDATAKLLVLPGAASRGNEANEAVAGLRQQCNEAVVSLTERKEALAGLLDKEESKDSLCRRFADSAREFQAFVNTKTAEVDALNNEPLDEEGNGVSKKQNSLHHLRDLFVSEAKPLLHDLEMSSQACEDANVAVNPHTANTLNGLRGSYEALLKVMRRADEVLTAQIMMNKSMEITPAQLKELKEVFVFFDEDNSGYLDLQELIEGCKGVGIDMEDDEVERKLKELNPKNKLGGQLLCDFECFVSLMLNHLETGDGVDAVRDAFKQLCNGSGRADHIITPNAVDRFFASASCGDSGNLAKYLHENMPVDEETEGYDYCTFTQQLFTC